MGAFLILIGIVGFSDNAIFGSIFIAIGVYFIYFGKTRKKRTAKKEAKKERERLANEAELARIKVEEEAKAQLIKEKQEKLERERQERINFFRTAELVCFDCETTGTNFDKDEILKLSIIDRNNNVLFNELIKPIHKRKWDDAETVNHISPQDVKTAKPITDYLQQLQEIFDKAELLVGYNLEFDMNFLSNSGILFREQKQFDVMLEFAEIYGEYNKRFGDYKWQKLSKCAAYYHYKWEGRAHDSLADTKATLFCFEEMIKE